MIARRFVTAGLFALSSLIAAPASAAPCDRTCMTGLITTYVDAVVAHDPSKLPLAKPAIRYTEDSTDKKLGEGIWTTITGKGTFRHDYLDTAKQVAAAHVHNSIVAQGAVCGTSTDTNFRYGSVTQPWDKMWESVPLLCGRGYVRLEARTWCTAAAQELQNL